MNLRKYARGRECTIRILGICNHDPETTVLAHLPNRAMGKKAHDLLGAWACCSCHDALDGRIKTDYSKIELRQFHHDGVIRTLRTLINEGILK